jgi:hypothetical protein
MDPSNNNPNIISVATAEKEVIEGGLGLSDNIWQRQGTPYLTSPHRTTLTYSLLNYTKHPLIYYVTLSISCIFYYDMMIAL